VISWFRYVKHRDVPAYLAQGWVVENNMADTHHGRHAVLMRWAGEGEPA
jgi:hypothetical protein